MKKLLKILVQYPENTVFIDDDLLLTAAKYSLIMKRHGDYIYSEMIYRTVLFNTEKFSSCLFEILNIVQKYKNFIKTNITEEITLDKKLNKIDEILYKKLDFINNSDGFIPVVYKRKGILIPFKLTKINDFESGCIIRDRGGFRIEEWTEGLKNISSSLSSKWDVALNVTNVNEDEMLFKGDSLCLPVYLGILRKLGQISYPLFEVISTGCVQDGCLTKTGSISEKEKIIQNLNFSFFLYPAIKEERSLLKEGDSLNQVHDKIKNFLIQNNLMKPDWRYSAKRIKELDSKIRSGYVSSFTNTLNEIGIYSKILNKFDRRQELLDAEMLRAVVLCHSGETQEAFDINKKTVTDARKMGLLTDAIKAQIRNIVTLTDFGNFEYADKLKYEIEEEIKELPENNTKNDIMMRYFGTVGQLCLYNGLFKNRNDLKNKAIEYFNKAVELAENHIEYYELSRELNYIHLYHVLTASHDLEKIYLDAENEISNISDLKTRNLNLSFLYRQRWLSNYRKLLLNNELLDYRDLRIPDKNVHDGWPFAMTMKYKGALLASENKYDGALKCFEQGNSVLADKNGLLRILYMTILAQCWSSLKDIPEFSKKTSEFYSEALGICNDITLNNNYRFIKKWKEYLEDKNKINPQLLFQY